MADIDPGAMQAYYRGDVEDITPTEKARRHLVEMAEARQKEIDMRMGASDWLQLKKELISHYGSITCGWRQGLDTSGDGKLSFLEFSKACRNMGFLGNVKKIFSDMDG